MPFDCRALKDSGTLVVPGATIAWEREGSGPTVVLIHGFALDRRMWDEVVPGLAVDHAVVRYDCRGFGASAIPDRDVPYSHSEDLFRLMDHLRIEQAALAGLSFGGQIALRCALLAPERVTALILIDAVLDGVPWDAESSAASGQTAEAARTEGVAAGRRAWLQHPLFAPACEHPELAARLRAMVATYPGHHWLGADPHTRIEPRPIESLGQVAAPTTVVVGERDVPCFGEMADVLAAGIPGARLVRIEGSGHMTPMEAPDLTLRAMRDALGNRG